MSDTEKSLRDKVRVCLESDFFVYEKWSGLHRNSGEKVYYDLVIKPKQHLIKEGFNDGYAVIEVKNFLTTDKVKHDTKAKDLFWQCIVYSYSDIQIPSGEFIKPLFVIYYIGGDGVTSNYKDRVNDLHHFIQRGGVGRLDIDAVGNWAMVFGGSNYYRKKYGKGTSNVGIKRMTGSSR
jgi:hypothetical protein